MKTKRDELFVNRYDKITGIALWTDFSGSEEDCVSFCRKQWWTNGKQERRIEVEPIND